MITLRDQISRVARKAGFMNTFIDVIYKINSYSLYNDYYLRIYN